MDMDRSHTRARTFKPGLRERVRRMKVLLDRQGHQDGEDQAEVDGGADIQPGSFGAVKLPFLIPTKEFSRVKESGEISEQGQWWVMAGWLERGAGAHG